MATGEGKTYVIAILNAVKALQGKQVYVITSSSVLAKVQTSLLANFYKSFKLICMENGFDKQESIECRKRIYQSNIIYGTIEQFEEDYLTDTVDEKHILNNKTPFVIIDEVDCMIIDEHRKILRMNRIVPGLSLLQPILFIIFNEMEIVHAMKDFSGNPYPTSVEDQNQLEEFLQAMVASVKKKITCKLDNCHEHLLIPLFFEDFVNRNLKKWIHSAMLAVMFMKEDEHYIVQTDQNGKKSIIPVDADITGAQLLRTSWQDCLHEFLEMKHNIEISFDTRTINFLSHVAYLKQLGCDVVGYTGTIGSTKVREYLNKIYEVDFVEIPPHVPRTFIKMTPLIANNRNEWLEYICETVRIHINNERAVLLLTKFISEAKEIQNELREKGIRADLFTNESEAGVIKNPLSAKKVIISTNIAGRGSDIRITSDVELRGGLHVCVTFLPTSERVTEQNLGRAARNGQRGTGQLILLDNNNSHDVYNATDTYNRIEENRMIDETRELNKFEENANRMISAHQVFMRFLEERKKIREWQAPADFIEFIVKDYEEQFSEYVDKTENLSIESFENWVKIYKNGDMPVQFSK